MGYFRIFHGRSLKNKPKNNLVKVFQIWYKNSNKQKQQSFVSDKLSEEILRIASKIQYRKIGGILIYDLHLYIYLYNHVLDLENDFWSYAYIYSSPEKVNCDKTLTMRIFFFHMYMYFLRNILQSYIFFWEQDHKVHKFIYYSIVL